MQKSSWIFGLLAGILSAIMEYLFFKSSESNANSMFLSKIIILTLCIILGLILAKKLLGGKISISRALLTGGIISLVRAIVMIISFLVLYYPSGDFYKSKVEIAFEQATLVVPKLYFRFCKDLFFSTSKLARLGFIPKNILQTADFE